MRPGLKAREGGVWGGLRNPRGDGASMRPGLKAREGLERNVLQRIHGLLSFNEARA